MATVALTAADPHGFAAKKFFLSNDEQPLFNHLRSSLVEHYRPATAHERTLLEELAEARWRARTARTMEAALLELLVADLRKADASLTAEKALARVFSDEGLQKRMRLAMRYLAAAERSVEKARAELEHVIALRKEAERREAQLRAFRTTPPPGPPPAPPAGPDRADRLCSVPPPNR
jgi:hypothetical protein